MVDIDLLFMHLLTQSFGRNAPLHIADANGHVKHLLVIDIVISAAANHISSCMFLCHLKARQHV
jgi:hypothetical protein